MKYEVNTSNDKVTVFHTKEEVNDAYDKVVDEVRASGYFLAIVTHIHQETNEVYGYSLARYKGGRD